MKLINAATCTNNYDFTFSDDGMLSIDDETKNSVASILKFDLNSNDDWNLDKDVGIHWLSSDNTGLLQVKASESQMINELKRKIINTDGVKAIESIEVSRGLNRKLYFKIEVVVNTNEKITIEKEV